MRPLRTALALLALAAGSLYAFSGPRLLHRVESAYNTLFVEEDAPGVRALRFERGGATQSLIRLGQPRQLEVAYTRAAMVALALVDEPKRVLIIGLGGGAMPMFVRALFPQARIEAVDIDPQVIAVAKRFFGFQEDERMKAIAADGREYVEKAPPGYDLIFLDAYGRDAIPRHLATVEFLERVRSRLAPGGRVVGNVWSGGSNPLYDAMRASYVAAFGDLCELRVPGSGNRIFLARSDKGPVVPPDLDARAAAFAREHRLAFDLSAFTRPGCLDAPPRRAEVLRDPPAEQKQGAP